MAAHRLVGVLLLIAAAPSWVMAASVPVSRHEDPVTSAIALEPDREALAGTPAARGYLHAKQNLVQIDALTLGRCLARETRRAYPRGLVRAAHAAEFPKLDDYLAGSNTHYTTAAKLPLRRWVTAQPDDSIDPVSIFRQALLLNNGDLFLAALTVHELLRNEARFDTAGYTAGYASTDDIRNRFFNKFIDLRGDLEARGPGFHGDHAGTWYRFYGIMTFLLRDAFRGDLVPGWEDNRLWGHAVAWVAEAIKPYKMQPEHDPGKVAVNYVATDVTIAFLQALDAPRASGGASLRCDPSSYLNKQ